MIVDGDTSRTRRQTAVADESGSRRSEEDPRPRRRRPRPRRPRRRHPHEREPRCRREQLPYAGDDDRVVSATATGSGTRHGSDGRSREGDGPGMHGSSIRTGTRANAVEPSSGGSQVYGGNPVIAGDRPVRPAMRVRWAHPRSGEPSLLRVVWGDDAAGDRNRLQSPSVRRSTGRGGRTGGRFRALPLRPRWMRRTATIGWRHLMKGVCRWTVR